MSSGAGHVLTYKCFGIISHFSLCALLNVIVQLCVGACVSVAFFRCVSAGRVIL